MLRELTIKGFILIDDARIPFGEGFNAITGETGAGKSILVGALDLVLGANASTDYIQPGKDRAVIQAVFEVTSPEALERLAALDITPEEGQVIVTRQIHDNARNVARINDEVTTLTRLRQAGEVLIDIHGQNEHQSLLRESAYLELIDRYLGGQIDDELAATAEAHGAMEAANRRLKEIDRALADRDRRLDLIDYQMEEIDEAALTEEDDDLDEIFRKQASLERAMEALSEVYARLSEDEGILDLIGRNLKALGAHLSVDDRLGPVYEAHDLASDHLQDAVFEMQRVVEDSAYTPEEMARLEKRLNTVNHLKRKYGKTVDEILAFRDGLEKERRGFNDLENEREETLAMLSRAEQTYDAHASALSEERGRAAALFEKAVLAELARLNLENARLAVSVVDAPPSPEGRDRITIDIATNKGLPLRPLRDVVSGGELSRIMLAVKNVLGEKSTIETMIFDEIDAGISGLTAQKVAETVYQLSRTRQIVAITHLPQIAVMADHHLMIEKRDEGDRTLTHMRLLSEEERMLELNRLLNGDLINEVARQNVANLYQNAAKKKAQINRPKGADTHA